MRFLKKGILLELAGILMLFCLLPSKFQVFQAVNNEAEKEYIKWVDFNVSLEALEQAYQYDISTYGQPVHLDWIVLLAYAAAKNGGSFSASPSPEIDALAKALTAKELSLEEATRELTYYPYYLEAYRAVLGGMVGEYELEEEHRWVKKYGLKAFSPIAKNFPYTDYDDFGASRSYGYKRVHLGHDMMGQTGTPIIAVESGYVEAIGWNQYGGWRLGIRSFDKKRYYYYAHLRQNFPFCKKLKEGSLVTAGDVIGYMGHTGYSTKENTNNIDTTHLHFGLQLIFDESQKEGNNEIWIDCYSLIRFLSRHRSETQKDPDTREWYRIQNMRDPAIKKEEAQKPLLHVE